MTMPGIARLAVAAAIMAFALTGRPEALAQGFPSKVIRIIVLYAAG